MSSLTVSPLIPCIAFVAGLATAIVANRTSCSTTVASSPSKSTATAITSTSPSTSTSTSTSTNTTTTATSTPTTTSTSITSVPADKVINRQGILENKVLSVGDWDARWSRGAIGWHRPDTHPLLIKHAHKLRTVSSGRRPRILVPLCGKSVDLIWLVNQGYQVIGIEYSPQAIDAFAREQHVRRYTVTQIQPDIWRYDMLDGDLIILQCDIFSPNLSYICCDGFVDLIWDKDAYNAIHPTRRQDYIDTLLRLKRPNEAKLMTYQDAKNKHNQPDTTGSVSSYDMLLLVHEFDGPETTTPYSCPCTVILPNVSHAASHFHHLDTIDRTGEKEYLASLQSTWWKQQMYGIKLR